MNVTHDCAHSALEVQHLTVELDGATLLDDVSLVVPEGRCVALIGPNGSGKSTFLRAVLGLVPIQEGVIRILGKHPDRMRRRIGYLPQYKHFDRSFPATALEVVVANLRGSWPARIAGAERAHALAALERFGAGALAARRVAELSGGELQRVFLARALVIEPELLLLDEPSTGLDPETRSEVDGILCTLAANPRTSMVVVTHDLRGMQTYANYAVYLDRRVLREGDPESILATAPDHVLFGHTHAEEGAH